MDKQGEWTGTWIPREVLLAEDLTPREKIAYATIAGFCDYFGSHEFLAERIGTTPNEARKIRHELKAKGYIRRTNNDDREPHYVAVRDFSTGTRKSPRKGDATSPQKGATTPPQKRATESKEEIKVKTKNNTPGKPAEHSKPETLEMGYARKLASQLHDAILVERPDRKIAPNWEKTWSADIEKTIRIDQRNPRALEAVIIWATRHDFWKRQILSGANLRKHYDRMIDQIKADNSVPERMRRGGFTTTDARDIRQKSEAMGVDFRDDI